jgi:predicted permease, DMT superfamily
MERAQGILYAALSSSTFGLAPLFTLLLLAGGYSPFEALSYRWGVAALFLGVLAVFSGRSFRLGRRELVTVFLLSLFRAVTSLSLIIAYQHIASGVASTIYFMYPLAVALAMMCFFREKGSAWVFAAIGMSVVGAVLLSLGNVDFTVENSALGMVSACVSVFSYGGYIVGVRKSRAVEIDSAVLTCYVMGLGGALFYPRRPADGRRPDRNRRHDVALHPRSRASRHGPLQHDAGAGDQAYRADADFDRPNRPCPARPYREVHARIYRPLSSYSRCAG